MGMLTIIMLGLFGLLAQTQRMWDLNDGRQRIYENSRLVFDVLERDLHSLVVDSDGNREIRYYKGDPDPATASKNLHATFIASGEPPTGSDSRLMEISYYHHADPKDSDNQYMLYRQSVCELDSKNWNFLNAPTNWHLNSTTPMPVSSNQQLICEGVDTLGISFEMANGAAVSNGSDTSTAANRVVVNLILFDPALKDAPPEKRFRTQRAFTKVFYLSHLQ
jgi:hypothetical protein